MEYDWDPNKRLSNIKKHGVDFADAVFILEDDCAITIEDSAHQEQRFVTIGSDPKGLILVVVYTNVEEHIRIISARKATKHECRFYEES